MPKSDVIAALITIGGSALATVMPDEEVRIIAFAAIGAALGGWVGASVNFGIQGEAKPSDARRAAVSMRWFTNFATALVFAPLFTDYLTSRFPDMSKTYLAIASGGILGISGVILLCIGIPALFRVLKKKTSRLP